MLDPAVLDSAVPAPPPPADDPKLIAAAKDIYEAQKAATKAGTPLSPDDIDAYVKDQTGGKFSGTDVGKYLGAINTKTSEWLHPSTWLPALGSDTRALANGLLPNWADKAAALVGGPGTKEKWDLGSEMYRDANPGTSGTMNVAGGLLLGKGIGKGLGAMGNIAESAGDYLSGSKVLRALPKVGSAVSLAGDAVAGALRPATSATGAIAQAAGMGAGIAGAANAGAAPEGERMKAALDPTTLLEGGALGALLPTILSGYKGMTNVGGAGEDWLKKIIADNGLDNLKKTNAEFGAAGLGDVTRLHDLHPELAAAAKWVTQNDPTLRAEMQSFTTDRLRDAPSRLNTQMGTLLSRQAPAGAGMSDINAPLAEDAARTSARAFGKKAYGDLRANNPEVANTTMPQGQHPLAAELERQITNLGIDPASPEAAQLRAQLGSAQPAGQAGIMAKLMEQPTVRTAIKRAQDSGEIGATPEPRDQASFEKMFQFKQDLQDAADRAITAGGGKSQHGFNLKEAAKLVDEHLQNNVEEYGPVSAEYKTRMQNLRGFDAGHEMFSRANAENIAADMAKLTPDQQHNARLAMASDLSTKLRGSTNAAQARQIMTTAKPDLGLPDIETYDTALSPKLKAIFGDQETLNSYLGYARLNAKLAQTGHFGGSDTNINQTNGPQSALGTAVKGMTSGLVTPGWNMLKSMAVRTVAAAGNSAIKREIAQRLAPNINATGTKNISDVLDAVTRSRSVLPAIATQGVPAALSGLLTRQP